METFRGLKFVVVMSFLLIQFSVYDAIADEKLQMKFSEPPSFKPSSTAMCTWLKNLESLGFQKEVVRKSVKRPGKDRPDAKKTTYYYKLGRCSQEALRDIAAELNSSVPGSFGKEIFRKVAEEVSFRRLNTGNGMCKVGLEVEFKGGQDCDITGRKKMDLSDPRIKRFLFPFKVKIEIKITIKF
ncbi:uncharacterized protein [Pocillopora verrucosa]|uniref:uncharacterized protein n=1 Tax=Pocillopora verrucosa TaxID=203993 RepID=UPI00333F35E6